MAGYPSSTWDKGLVQLTDGHDFDVTLLFRHLNRHDVRNLAVVARSSTDPWLTNQILFYGLREARAMCDELRPPGNVNNTRCRRADDPDMKWCEKLPASGTAGQQPAVVDFAAHDVMSFNVCGQCRRDADVNLRPLEESNVNGGQPAGHTGFWVSMCKACTSEERRRGARACVCLSKIQDPWYCRACRIGAHGRAVRSHMHNLLILYRKRRDPNRRNGRIIRVQVPTLTTACRCGVTLNDRNRGTGEICTGCEGVRGPGVGRVRGGRTHGMQTRRMARGEADVDAWRRRRIADIGPA